MKHKWRKAGNYRGFFQDQYGRSGTATGRIVRMLPAKQTLRVKPYGEKLHENIPFLANFADIEKRIAAWWCGLSSTEKEKELRKLRSPSSTC